MTLAAGKLCFKGEDMNKINSYKGICQRTNKNETIWVDMINTSVHENKDNFMVGLMRDCSVRIRTKELNICKDCNILKELKSM